MSPIKEKNCRQPFFSRQAFRPSHSYLNVYAQRPLIMQLSWQYQPCLQSRRSLGRQRFGFGLPFSRWPLAFPPHSGP